MKTGNAAQLKARVNNRAREAGMPPKALMQSYLIERLLERLSRSERRERLVIKGGVPISSLVRRLSTEGGDGAMPGNWA